MAVPNSVDVAAIMNMVAALSPEGSGVRKEMLATPAVQPTESGATEAALAGARDIVAELVAEDPENTADLREYTHKTAAIEPAYIGGCK